MLNKNNYVTYDDYELAMLELEIEMAQDRINYDRLTKCDRHYEAFYDWQYKFNKATASHTAAMLMAANQIGKTLTACVIAAHHLTGEYPEDWEGHEFDFPPLCWLLGYSGEKTRDLLQAKLFGQIIDNELQGGLIPRERIIDKVSMNGTSRAMREVKVQHENGIAVCQFWSYSQGAHALMGDVIDFFVIDEEPVDHEIYPQIITRTLNGDRGRGGRGMLTFTPENGKTELVAKFMDNDVDGQYLLNATWDDAPHMTKEKKEAALQLYPPHQRDMRSKGVPLMGSGLIYQIDEDLVKCEPFKIPFHYRIINGLDFGWDHPLALVQLAICDETGIIYVCKAFKASKTHAYQLWNSCKDWSDGVPVAWPQDGYQSDSNGTKEVETRDKYIDAGFEMLDRHATWEAGGVSVQEGIVQLNERFKNGKLKIFSNLVELFEEIRMYHTVSNDKGDAKIYKKDDDLLDALRYAFMMRREALVLADIKDDGEDDYPPGGDDTNCTGY